MKAIEVEHLTKFYPNGVRAVDDISFSVEEGQIFGFLGPNGAGKTTTIKVITTLGVPTSGSVRVFGIDVTKAPSTVRRMLGYVPQAISVDGDLTAYENLLIFARLFDVEKKIRGGRIRDALQYMGLAERANDLVKHYSGGMMRRLEIAQAIVNRPRILFLDEPSIGLDPSSKIKVWGYVKGLNRDFGVTIFLTTHDMTEADELCDKLAIMNAGKIAVSGPPNELKKSLGGDLVTVTTSSEPVLTSFPAEIGSLAGNDDRTVRILTQNGEAAIPKITEYLRASGVTMESISVSKPDLNDVFVKYTSMGIDEAESFSQAKEVRRSFTRHAR
ncbi:MAG: ATP-binding cassette domain-containing protein [Thaumarchaeota archaeon]|nr:ATP-binding cassette domain-containing protein [Nitrososphaerota archaeon]